MNTVLQGLRPRIAALAGLALAALLIGSRASAQATGPLPASPPYPTPYHSPLFHSGGASTGTTYPLLGPDPLTGINPLFSQGQGTPTAVYPPTLAGVPTQIPSFLLGNYVPAEPPTTAGVYFPDHFADGYIYSFAAPFAYVPTTIGSVTVDDTAAAFTGPWAQLTTGPAAGTATNGEYYRLAPQTNGSAQWTLTATNPGSFSVYFHIPDNIDDGSGNAEVRSSSVTYTVAVTTAANGTTTGTATVSQTEANSSQFLAGPFQLAIGDSVVVKLQRTAGATGINELPDSNNVIGNYYLIADSMTLQSTIGDVQSTPTAINATAYPTDFANAVYWGINATAGGLPTDANPTAADYLNTTSGVAVPDTGIGTTPVLRYGNPVLASDASHEIRQLVYFGRSEPTFTSQALMDDSAAAPTAANNFNGFTPGAFTTVVTSASATNGEYRAGAAVNTPTTPNPAIWSLTAPNGGNYFVTVNLPPLATTPTAETRITDAQYTVSVNGVARGTYTVNQSTTFGSVMLPTGPIPLRRGVDVLTVSLSNLTANAITGTPPPDVAADSVTITTGSGAGAIYCVDGFTGGVVWRYEIPGSADGPSAPVFSSPAVAKINVLTPAGTYANKLVVIVGDNNGLVYCLDAIGNGDGTSNADSIDTTTGQPIYSPQPLYGATVAPITPATVTATNAHVGTTPVYWIYRPDPNQAKYATGANFGQVKGSPDITSDLPVPQAFGTASPTIFVDPTVSTTAPTASNATVYIGNSNGVLYAFDPLGIPATAERFNASLDLRINATDPVIPTCQPKWWFSLRGPNADLTTATSSADIESAPAIYVDTTTTPGSYLPRVYIGSAHEQESTSNVGRLYALDGLLGPSGDNGRSPAQTLSVGAPATTYTGPGSFNYNIGQRPQTTKTDTAHWSFPDGVGTDAYSTGQSSTGAPRPALGNITGSPVVFTNFYESATAAYRTRIYFAANTGLEVPTGSAAGTVASPRPDSTTTGRVWAVNLDGSVGTTTNSGAAAANGSNVWAYPQAWDPNNAKYDTVAEPYAPIGAFLNATPAIGFVQFPTTITNGDGSTYTPTDVIFNTGGGSLAPNLKGQSVPMLYIGTAGVNDTSLYGVDIDGTMTGASNGDSRTIYRLVSPDGSLFQSSPILVTNATAPAANPPGPGNGGAIYITAGDTLYDFGATPIANPIAGQAFPLIRENRAFVGFGPISGPAVAAADVSDLQGFGLTSEAAGVIGTATGNVTDWVYVGDSSTGFCRGITPRDLGDLNIPPQLASIVPVDANAPQSVDLTSIVQTYLVSDANKGSTDSTQGLIPGPTAPLPVYEWGQNIYIRFKNVVPPNPTNNTALYLHDITGAAPSTGNPATYYSNGGPIEFDLSVSDAASTANGLSTPRQATDHGTVPALVVAALPANGFIARTDAAPTSTTGTATNNLVDGNGAAWIGAYTYAIGDGTVRRNTPGGRRQVLNAHQTVMAYTTTDGVTFSVGVPTTIDLAATATNGNEVTVQTGTGTGNQPVYGFKTVGPVDQPTFGILNPLGLRAGGTPLPIGAASPTAVQIGDELGPFRGVSSAGTIPSTGSAAIGSDAYYDLEALTDGNDVYTLHAPPSTSGIGDPIALQAVGTSAGGITPTQTRIVVTSTPLISHNTSGDNLDLEGAAVNLPTGSGSTGTGLSAPNFGSGSLPYAVDIFDRTPLGLAIDGNRTVSARMNLSDNAGGSGSGGLYWNSNFGTNFTPAQTTHDSVVNYLPWETPPVAYNTGSANSSPDYPDISPQNMSATLHSTTYGDADLQGTSGTLTPANGASVTSRTIVASALQVHIAVPHHQPANQQVYVGSTGGYNTTGELPPLTSNGTTYTSNLTTDTFPMGYITTRRIYVPNRQGSYRPGAAYRDLRIYTGVPVDMSTSIANPTTDIGIVPAAFGVQTEQYPGLNPMANEMYFSPYNPAFQNYFKPLEVHNDGNVNLLNVHFDQKLNSSGTPTSLLLHSDAVDPLSALSGYDLAGITGPRTGTLPNGVTEEPYLIRSSVDTDLVDAYLQSTNLAASGYVGATFHKPTPGGDAPSILTVPDSPEDATSAYYLSPSPTGMPTVGANGVTSTTPPLVSLAMPFGTPVGTYATTPPSDLASLRLFEGLDVPNANAPNEYSLNPAQIYYPPFYGGVIGGIYQTNYGVHFPTTASLANNDVYTGAQPLSATGTQLSGTVEEQRLTDGFTYGAVPMIDGGPAGPTVATSGAAAPQSTPDFAPAGFRDPTTGDLSVYWTSRRNAGGYGIIGANLPFTLDPANNTLGTGYFLPTTPTAQWWQPISAPVVSTTGTNSGLTIAQDSTNAANIYAFAVNVATTTPYNNTLYSYTVTPSTGALTNGQPITADPSQIKYGIKGLATGTTFTQNLWAFWTASTRGRTAIAYNATTGGSAGGPAWSAATQGILPIPAGLTSVADPSPLLMSVPINGNLASVLEVTYSGTGPNGNVDLYLSRYQPDATTSSKLDLIPFPAMTEILTPVTGSAWYQTRDAAWSRTGELNVFVGGTPILYNGANALFSKAIFDKASGQLVLTGISGALKDGAGNNVFTPGTGTVTVYVDAATGRVRFAGGTPLTTETLTATFNPLARRLTTDPRADTAPITLLDHAQKPNDAAALGLNPVVTDRRWTLWRKSGTGGDPASATLYSKSQRLTLFLPGPIGVSASPALLLTSVTVNGTDVTSQVDVDYTRGRIYFPTSTLAEGQSATATYAPANTVTVTNPNGTNTTVTDTVQWQDEAIINDVTNLPTTTLAGLNTVLDYKVPIHTAVNENNVTAFLDPFASATSEHKLWLFWNSTRNGTADIYSETINPRF